MPSAMSNSTMSPISRVAARWASVPPIIPEPISAIFLRAMEFLVSPGAARGRGDVGAALKPPGEGGQPKSPANASQKQPDRQPARAVDGPPHKREPRGGGDGLNPGRSRPPPADRAPCPA